MPFILVVAVQSQRWRALKTTMGLNSQKGQFGVRNFGDSSENEAADGAPNRRSIHDKAAEWPE